MRRYSARQRPPAWLIAYTLGLLGGTARILRLLYQHPEHPPIRPATAGGPTDPLIGVPPLGAEGWPFVSIIVPARNEARNLPNLLPSLLEQSYPADRFEVIVVDDQSSDATPAILAEFAARYPQLTVVPGQPLPEGWKGKPWAMHQGVQHARGEWFLFTDADTVHHAAGLSSSIADAVARAADLYTIAPCPVLVGPAERLLMPVVFLGIFIFFHPTFVNDPRNPIAIANGQYILLRRSVYDAVGGVARVRADIAEDLELGRLVKRAGYQLYLTDGEELMRVRMYHNLAEVWEGWRKNVLLSMRKQPLMGVAQLLSILTGGLIPFALFARYGLAAARRRSAPAARPAFALAAAQVAILLVMKRGVDRKLDLPLGWMFAYPVGMLMFTLILADSFRRLLSGEGVTWKGRSYTS